MTDGDDARNPSRPRRLERLRAVEVDVRGDIARGGEPFARIMGAVKALADDEALVVRAPFEPVPLYRALERQGFAHWTERRAVDDWSVAFYRATEILDVRELEPPLPMVRVLERLDTLAPGETLVVVHERRPLFLYPQIEERGFVHETEEPEPGMVRITIRHGHR